MMPGMNPRQMKQAMKRMGIQQQDINAVEVIIKTKDSQLVFENPQVAKVNMMGQNTYQVVGEPVEQALSTEPEITEDDVKTVMEQTQCNEEEAKKVLEETNGDIAEAILKLNE